jgi:hypothetical protein
LTITAPTIGVNRISYNIKTLMNTCHVIQMPNSLDIAITYLVFYTICYSIQRTNCDSPTR